MSLLSRRITVVIVDDEPSDVVLIRRLLEAVPNWDMDVVECAGSTDAMREIARRDVDVVLLDYALGADCGLTLLRAVRAAGQECPFVMLTGQGDELLAVEALQAGAADYLPKRALSVSSIGRAITNAVERRRLESMVRDHQRNLENLNEWLERRNREIEGFYHSVSHELKTPLTSIRELLGLALDGFGGPLSEPVREYVTNARECADHMTHCIDDLLDATRLETGKMRLARRPVQVAELLTRTVRALEPIAAASSVRLDLRCEEDLPVIDADAVRVAQIVRNLVTNAIKFSPPDSAVVIELRRTTEEPATVSISVADRGCGIAPQHLDRIFERLYQVCDEELDTNAGLGLGLSLAKELTELHGGRMVVESEPGQGAEFTFTLRTAVDAPDASAELQGAVT